MKIKIKQRRGKQGNKQKKRQVKKIDSPWNWDFQSFRPGQNEMKYWFDNVHARILQWEPFYSDRGRIWLSRTPKAVSGRSSTQALCLCAKPEAWVPAQGFSPASFAQSGLRLYGSLPCRLMFILFFSLQAENESDKTISGGQPRRCQCIFPSWA